MRTLKLALALALACVALPAQQQPDQQDQQPAQTAPQQDQAPGQPQGQAQDQGQDQAPAEASTVPLGSLYLPDADLMQVIDTLAQQLQINYVVDAEIEGTVTLNTYGEAGQLDARNLLDLLLRINGYGMVQEGNLYRIVDIDRMRRMPINQVTQSSDIPADDEMMLNLVFLKYITVAELTKILTEFTDDRTILSAYAPANLLLVMDSRRNMRRIMDLVDQFDSDMFAGERVRLYDIENTLPSQLMGELEPVLQSLSLDNQTSTVRFLPIDRISTLIAIAPNPGVFETVTKWIEKLDTPIVVTSGLIDTYVYRVRYGRADCLAQAITRLYFPGMNMGGGYGGGFGGAALRRRQLRRWLRRWRLWRRWLWGRRLRRQRRLRQHQFPRNQHGV